MVLSGLSFGVTGTRRWAMAARVLAVVSLAFVACGEEPRRAAEAPQSIPSAATSAPAPPREPARPAMPRSLAAGNTNACRIEASGLVSCWGSNGHGESAGTKDAVDVALSVFYGCAVRRDGSVACWGSDPIGKTKPPPLDDAIRVGASERAACALRRSGTVTCWGERFGAQPGSSELRVGFSPPLRDVRDIALASYGYHALLLASDGVYRWGRNETIDASTPREGCAVLESRRGVIEPLAGALPAAGSDAWARLLLECSRPLRVEVDEATSLALGVAHACALDADGHVRCWGDNHSGALGDGTNVDRPRPVEVVELPEAIAIAAGGFHSCAITHRQEVYCWGDNRSGALGDGSNESRTKPVLVEGLANVTALACGTGFSCAETDIGEVHCWGSGSFGQLGDGSTEDSPRPRRARASSVQTR